MFRNYDGVYYLTVLNSSVSPTVSPFTGEKFTQPIKYLYPQVNRDNPVADPTQQDHMHFQELLVKQQ